MGLRVLIIEDNAANLELMNYLLRAFGHQPIAASDGLEGCRLAQETRPDVIICDIQLPGADGYAVARTLKSDPELRNIPLIAVTALAMVGDRDKALAAGFDGYITKPIDPESFVGRVNAFTPAPETHPTSASSAGDHSPSHAVSRSRTARANVLVVDDITENLRLITSILEPFGYSVTAVGTMAAALKFARETPPQLIISDVYMKDGDGFEFIKAVKAQPGLARIPFLFVTSTYQDAGSRTLGLSLGARRFLSRPLEPEALLAEVEACLEEAQET